MVLQSQKINVVGRYMLLDRLIECARKREQADERGESLGIRIRLMNREQSVR